MRYHVACLGTLDPRDSRLCERLRMLPCRDLSDLKASHRLHRLDGLVYCFADPPSVRAHELIDVLSDTPLRIPVLVRMGLGSFESREFFALCAAGVDARASIRGSDTVDVVLDQFVRTLESRSPTSRLVHAIVPLAPLQSRKLITGALLMGSRRASVQELRGQFNMSERSFRAGFEVCGTSAGQLMRFSLTCHGLGLLETGEFNMGQVASLLGFENSDDYSARVHRAVGCRPSELIRRTTSSRLIEAFRLQFRARPEYGGG
jgi:AraC-like DNA-binding protein